MSKIQDAIKRLQSSQQTPPSRRVRDKASEPAGRRNETSEESQTIATLKLPDPDDFADDPAYDGPVVAVDYDLLREKRVIGTRLDQQRHIADQYRLIKRPLLNNIDGRSAHQSDDMNLIMIASALPGDGKTFNCLNLALSMATEKDKSVLLVDADVAKPHISTLFDIDNQPGLLDLLT